MKKKSDKVLEPLTYEERVCIAENKVIKLEEAIKSVMYILENMPCGGVGADGPSLDELQEYVEYNRSPMENDAIYHNSQEVWRILDGALKGEEISK